MMDDEDLDREKNRLTNMNKKTALKRQSSSDSMEIEETN